MSQCGAQFHCKGRRNALDRLHFWIPDRVAQQVEQPPFKR